MENLPKVGYARVDITPEQYTNLGGLGDDAHLETVQIWFQHYIKQMVKAIG